MLLVYCLHIYLLTARTARLTTVRTACTAPRTAEAAPQAGAARHPVHPDADPHGCRGGGGRGQGHAARGLLAGHDAGGLLGLLLLTL